MHQTSRYVNLEARCSWMVIAAMPDAMHTEQLLVLRQQPSYEASYSLFLLSYGCTALA